MAKNYDLTINDVENLKYCDYRIKKNKGNEDGFLIFIKNFALVTGIFSVGVSFIAPTFIVFAVGLLGVYGYAKYTDYQKYNYIVKSATDGKFTYRDLKKIIKTKQIEKWEEQNLPLCAREDLTKKYKEQTKDIDVETYEFDDVSVLARKDYTKDEIDGKSTSIIERKDYSNRGIGGKEETSSDINNQKQNNTNNNNGIER